MASLRHVSAVTRLARLLRCLLDAQLLRFALAKQLQSVLLLSRSLHDDASVEHRHAALERERLGLARRDGDGDRRVEGN
jgi:hypothetical protein